MQGFRPAINDRTHHVRYASEVRFAKTLTTFSISRVMLVITPATTADSRPARLARYSVACTISVACTMLVCIDHAIQGLRSATIARNPQPASTPNVAKPIW